MFRSDSVLSGPLRVHKSDSSTDMMSNTVQLERWRESHVKLGSYFWTKVQWFQGFDSRLDDLDKLVLRSRD
jgi:hypothetical protein